LFRFRTGVWARRDGHRSPGKEVEEVVEHHRRPDIDRKAGVGHLADGLLEVLK